MKKFLCVLFVAVFVLLCGACGEKQPETNSLLADDGKTLRLLAITSSFGVDTTDYLYEIAKAQGVENVVVGRLYVGASTLKQHVTRANGEKPVYEYTKNSTGEFVTTEKVTIAQGLQDEQWDVIFLQQSAAESALVETYEDYIDQLIAYVDQHKTNPNAKYIWNMTWAYQGDSTFDPFVGTFNCDQMAMYNAIVASVKEKVVGRTDIAAISPTGTAIQNARTSYFGDLLTRDTRHLNEIGKVVAGYALFATLTNAPLTEVALTEVNPTFKLSDSNKEVILDAVNAAIKEPFAVTQSAYPD
jgi:hypothetical protein